MKNTFISSWMLQILISSLLLLTSCEISISKRDVIFIFNEIMFFKHRSLGECGLKIPTSAGDIFRWPQTLIFRHFDSNSQSITASLFNYQHEDIHIRYLGPVCFSFFDGRLNLIFDSVKRLQNVFDYPVCEIYPL